MIDILVPLITDKQFSFIKDLVGSKDWMNLLDGPNCIIVKKVIRKTPDATVESLGIARKRASGTIDALLKLPKVQMDLKTLGAQAITNPKTQAQSFLTNIPASIKGVKYAVKSVDPKSPNDWIFYEVKLWKGQKFLNRLQGAPGGWNRKFVEYVAYEIIAQRIQGATFTTAEGEALTGPKAAAWKFADIYEVCSACGANLSNKISLAQAMGPICVKKFA